jgi:hypothetical protein
MNPPRRIRLAGIVKALPDFVPATGIAGSVFRVLPAHGFSIPSSAFEINGEQDLLSSLQDL